MRADCMENTARVWSRKNEVGTAHRDEILNNYPHSFFSDEKRSVKRCILDFYCVSRELL